MKRVLLTVVSIAALLALAFTASASAKTTRRCVVPNLSGVTLKVARQRLTHAHCSVGRVHRPDAASGNLIVSRQVPRAHARRTHDAKVTVWLSAKTTPPPVTLTVPTTTTTTPATTVRASIDPTYVQSPTDPLEVTWTYSASATGADDSSLPAGVLTLSVQPDSGGLGPVGGCSMDVGGATTGGTCTVELPSGGAYSVTVTYYASGSGVAPATYTEVDTITGTTAPTWQATTTALTVGQVSVYNYTGPPPTYLSSTTTTVPLDVTTSDPTPAYSVTITDVTSGATATGSWDSVVPCGLQFGGPTSTATLTGCGIASMPFSYTDTLDATVTTEAAFPYEASTSATVAVWSGSLPAGAVVNGA